MAEEHNDTSDEQSAPDWEDQSEWDAPPGLDGPPPKRATPGRRGPWLLLLVILAPVVVLGSVVLAVMYIDRTEVTRTPYRPPPANRQVEQVAASSVGESTTGNDLAPAADDRDEERNPTQQADYEVEQEETGQDHKEPTVEASPSMDGKAILAGLRDLVEEGRAMEPYRDRSDNSNLRVCGEMMREYQPQARNLQEEAKKLSGGAGVFLGAAANYANLCVSCTPTALDYCNLAEREMREAEGLIR